MAINVKTISQLSRAETIKDDDLFEVSIKSNNDKYTSNSISCGAIINKVTTGVVGIVSVDYVNRISEVDTKVSGLTSILSTDATFLSSPSLSPALTNRVLNDGNLFPTVDEVRERVVG